MPTAPKPTTSFPVTIMAGQALSSSLDLSSGSVALLIAPNDWTPANMSFQVSDDGVNFSDLYDWDGNEILKAVGPGRALLVPPDLTAAALHLKIRSGPRINPVVQQADRTFTCVVM